MFNHSSLSVLNADADFEIALRLNKLIISSREKISWSPCPQPKRTK
ncbi:Uncharacterised protein [Vibrio cholerae]|nr:Uncharacterised protein [Vibrio cholerae]CSI53017.1 Uncharacterised protein [Vibrio cholerae]